MNTKIKPETGMGITATIYTDREVLTITRVSDSGLTFWAKPDKAVRCDKLGMTDSGQQYVYVVQPDENEVMFRMTKKGWHNKKYIRVSLDVRAAFHDYTF